MTDSDKNIEFAETIARHAVDGKPAPAVQATATLACAHALVDIAKELQAIRQIMDKMRVNRGTIWAKR